MTTKPPPVEYQGANALATVLRVLSLDDVEAGAGLPFGVAYLGHTANVVAFTVHGVAFHAVITAV